ncbi:PD-(D/E)XK nuclease family transposase [Slackia heliotrinireducens]|uniref:PD-(D/E)XK nuclease family transposase n=1 Tax=Slackia heliotrinireducens TaxID=84110 RepID=UPI0033155174
MSEKNRPSSIDKAQAHPYPDMSYREAEGIPNIEPLFNDAFIRIFGREESRGITRSLINAVLSHANIEPIDEIVSIEAEHTSLEGSINCKAPRMDVRIIATNRRVIDLKAQCYPEDIENRSLLYASQLMSANTMRGTKFKDIPQVIVITLLDDAALFPDTSEYVSTCQLGWHNDDKQIQATDRMLFVLVELEKVRKRYNLLDDEVLGDELLSWLYLLTSGFNKSEEASAIMDAFPDIEEFAKMYGYALNDPKVVRAYADFESAEREYQSRKDYFERVEREAKERGFKHGQEKGLEMGIEQGLQQGLQQGLEQGLQRGLEQGLQQGLEQGLQRGLEQGLEQSIAALRAVGMDEAADLLEHQAGTNRA